MSSTHGNSGKRTPLREEDASDQPTPARAPGEICSSSVSPVRAGLRQRMAHGSKKLRSRTRREAYSALGAEQSPSLHHSRHGNMQTSERSQVSVKLDNRRWARFAGRTETWWKRTRRECAEARTGRSRAVTTQGGGTQRDKKRERFLGPRDSHVQTAALGAARLTPGTAGRRPASLLPPSDLLGYFWLTRLEARGWGSLLALRAVSINWTLGGEALLGIS